MVKKPATSATTLFLERAELRTQTFDCVGFVYSCIPDWRAEAYEQTVEEVKGI